MLTQELSEAISYRQAVDFLPGTPHYLTVRRWMTFGVRGVVLESWVVGKSRMTSLAAIERFLQRLNTKTPKKTEPKSASRSTELARALQSLGC